MKIFIIGAGFTGMQLARLGLYELHDFFLLHYFVDGASAAGIREIRIGFRWLLRTKPTRIPCHLDGEAEKLPKLPEICSLYGFTTFRLPV